MALATTQPKITTADAENVLKTMDVSKVRSWTEKDVTNNFLKPLGFEYCSKVCEDNKVSGVCLLGMNDTHLKEMNVLLLGDRIQMLEYMEVLKKKRKQADRGKTLWEGQTPVKAFAYADNCCQWMYWWCCPCWVYRTTWRITSQGIRHRKPRFFAEAEAGFIDFRFLKDIETRHERRCGVCCPYHQLVLYADDASVKAKDQETGTEEQIVISHPDCLVIEDVVRNAWSEVRLVAD